MLNTTLPTSIIQLNIFEMCAFFLFLFHLTRASHSNAWPGTASKINKMLTQHVIHSPPKQEYNSRGLQLKCTWFRCLQEPQIMDLNIRPKHKGRPLRICDHQKIRTSVRESTGQNTDTHSLRIEIKILFSPGIEPGLPV